VYYSDENENEKALEEIEKAYYLWPAEKTRYILQWYLSYVTSNGDYRQERNVKHLQLLCRFNKFHDKEVSAERIKYEFNRVMKAQLTESSDYAMFERSFKAISLCIEDSTLKEEIAFMYHYELARLGYLNFRSKEYELEHLKEAYRINPKHADLQTIIKSYFGKLVDKNDNVVSVSKHLESFVDDFDFLKTDLVFNTIKTNCILELAYQSYTLGEAARGEKLLNDFEDLCKHNNEMKPVERFVEKAYATAASYYYKRGNVSKTKEILKRGITYAPENFGLQMRLSQTR
jgi:tetratricopeptide (TPR) repeat protein